MEQSVGNRGGGMSVGGGAVALLVLILLPIWVL